MPSLPKPRLRRHRGSELVAPAEQRERQPAVEIVEGSGLRWINIERPTPTFMPQMLAIRVSGRTMTLIAVSTRRMSLTRWEM